MRKFDNKGFTLIELLAVIIIMSLILTIGIPAISKIAEKNKARAFFISVSNIVDSVGSQSVFDDKNKCIYYYEYDKDNLPSNVATLYIIVRPGEDSSSAVYGVYAEQYDNERTIDISDFSTAEQNDQTTWVADVNDERSATWVVSSLNTNFISTNVNNPDIIDYKFCSRIS